MYTGEAEYISHKCERAEKASWEGVMASHDDRSFFSANHLQPTATWESPNPVWTELLKLYGSLLHTSLRLCVLSASPPKWRSERKRDFRESCHLHCSELTPNHPWNCVHWGESPSSSLVQSSTQLKQERTSPPLFPMCFLDYIALRMTE